jgi:rhodanese-like protein
MSSRRTACVLFFFAALVTTIDARSAFADPSKYPQFAQETLPDNITPAFIHIEELVAELNSGVQPLIIDVRTEEEYREVHILGAVSAPLGEFKSYLKSIPRDRPLVLY